MFDKPLKPYQSIWAQKEIHLSYNENFFSFEFVALDYTAPQNNQYAYMLEGFDNDWIYCGTRRYAAYTNLGGGEYIFRVKGSNNDRVWNEQGTSIMVIIAPPFWRTWWFIVLSISTFITIIYLIYHYRVNQLLKIERMRTRIATDLHDDIGASLSRIALFSEVAKEEASKASPRLLEMSQKIGDNARELLDAVGTLVWSIDPRHDRFDDVITHMKNFAQEMFSVKGIEYSLDIQPELSKLRLPLDVRKNLLLVFKEAVNNVVKHADCKTAQVSMRLVDGLLEMNITDDGKGLPAHGTHDGHGLTNMKLRAQAMNADLSIHSRDGKGAVVSLRLSLARKK